MASRRPARRRPSHSVSHVHRAGPDRGRKTGELDGARRVAPGGLRWSCAVIFLAGVALIAIGGWGLLRTTGRAAVALGSASAIVFGALLIVFAALLPWLADGPIRLGPLVVTLSLRRRPGRRRRQR